MKTEVAASESQVIQKDDDLYPSDTIAEQAVNQHALLKHPESMDKKEEDISEEVYISPEMTDESIKACLPETGIKLTAPSITSVDDTQNTHDDIRHEIPSAEKGDMELTLPMEQEAEINQTSLQECSSMNMGDSIDKDLEVTDIDHEKNEINAETSQISSMLLKPDIEETAEHVSGEMEEENLSEQILPPLKEKSIEQPFHEESREVGDISAQLKAEDDSSMKTTEIQVENKHIPLTADQEDKSPQDLSYEKESDNERISPEDAQQISEEISKSRNVSCADEEAEPISEPQQSYQEILEPSQITCEGANDSKENANENSSEREVTTSTEEVLVDSSSTIEHSSKKIESEIYESKTVRSEDGAYVDQLAEHARIEAIEKSSQVGLAAVTGPANIQENDEHQTCQTEVEENETVSEMIKQNQIFPESDSQEKNVISTESISYDNANMTNVALEGDNNEKVELKAEKTGYRFEEQNVETATREPYSRDQISSTDEISVPFSVKGDSAISTDSDKISSLNDNGNMESIDTEAKLDMMQEVENKREIVVETASDDITEEINDESYTVSQNQVDNLTNKATDEPSLIIDSRQNIALLAEDQISKLADVKEKEYESEEEKNSTEEENESIPSPDKDTENDFESNKEDIQNDSKPGQTCVNEPDIVKNLDTVSDIEETKLDQGEQNQENSIQIDAIGTDGDAQSTFTNIEPSPENNDAEDVELRTTRDVTSAEEKLEDSTNSAAAENNVTSEASINKGDEQNEKQSLSVTCVQSRTEAEDTINKADDSLKEIDLQYTEETQSTRDATVESFPNAITDETEDDKNLENTDADPSQQHDETNTKNSNYDEESNEYKEQEPSESNEFHLEDESNTEEAKNQVYEEERCSNKEGNNGTVEVSQSQDECSKVYEDSVHVIEVEETKDKQHEEQEDRSPYGEHGGVLGIDSQNENELNTSNSDGADGVHVQEDQTERESCKNDEMDESDTRKNEEIIRQEFEQDKLVNAITSQESPPPIEPLEHNLGDAMGNPTVSQPSEIVDDEALSFEASQAVGLEAEENIQTNEDPEQENDLSADTEFQEMNANPVELSEHIGTESDNIEVKNGGRDDEEDKVLVTDPKIEGEISTGIPSQSGKLDQEINADNPVKSRDEGTEESSEVMQVVDIHEDVSADCPVSAKEVLNQVLHLDAGTDLQQENERNTASLDYMQVQENQGGMDELHSEKDEELINQGFEQDSISGEMPCQETSATIEALRQDIGTAMDDHTLNEPSEIANDKVHIVEVSKEADMETDQHNQTNEEPEHENEISAEESMDVENHEFIPESAELREVNNTEDEAINSRAVDLNSKTAEDLSGNENTNSEISQMVTNLDEDPEVNTEVMPQDMSVENRELVPESVELAEEKNTENEAINSRAEELGSNTIEDSGNENTDLEISQKEISTVVLEDTDVENHNLIPESTELKEESNAKNEAIIDSRTVNLGSNTVEDLSGNKNTHSEISGKVAKLDEDPEFNTEVMHQDLSVENRVLVPELVELIEENNTENEAVNSRAEDLGSNTVGDSGNENTNLEISQTAISLKENPIVNREVVLQVMDVENHGLIPELTELREENKTENEAIKSRGEDLGSNSIEDLTGYENSNSEISQKEINSDEDPTVNTEIVPQDMIVESRALVPESAELAEENSTENEAIKSRVEILGSNTVEDRVNENTNLEISQKEISFNENLIVNTDDVLQDMSVENHELVLESGELAEEKNTENEAINSRAKELGSNAIEDSGNENTDLEISQKEINTEVVLEDMDVENHNLIPESTELREESNAENEAIIDSRAADLGSNTVEDLNGNENTHTEISQKVAELDEDPRVNTEVMHQDLNVENRELVPESVELTEENNTENEAIKSRGEDLGSNSIEDLTGYENTNSEIPQKEINSNENPTVNTEIVPQDIELENHELIPESTELREENNADNEEINIRPEDDLSGNEITNSEMSQKVKNLDEDPKLDTEVMPQDMRVENHGFISESTELREDNTENEAVDSIAKALGSNTVKDLGENQNTNSEISQNEINLDEDPKVDTEIVLQDMSVEDHALVPESAELTEDNNTENEAINSRAEDLGSNTVEDSGNENTDFEISQKEISLNENPIVNSDIQQDMDMDVESHELIPESTELREEDSTENEEMKCRAVGLGSNTVEDLSGNENTNSEMSQKVTNLDEDSRVDTEVVPQDVDVGDHEIIPESTELREENNTEDEATNSRAEDLGSNTVEDLSGKENTNSEISQRVKNLDEDSIVNTGVMPKEMDMENHEFIQESIELREENNTENEAINRKADDLGSNTIEDTSGKENTNLEISQKEISLNEDPIVETEGVPQNMDVENNKLIPDSTEVIEENKTENEAINSKAEDLGPNTAGDLGEDENTNSVISQREINMDEDPIVKTMEKIQDEEPVNTVRESTQEGSQHTLAEERTIDQEKPVDTADASQLENEEKTCMYDDQIQEVKETHEQCKINEMNESEPISFKNTEIESQGFEDDFTSKQIQNKQTPVHSEAYGRNVGAEMPNQDNKECGIDALEVNNREEVAEYEEHRNEAIVDESYEQEVICTNASSSGNEMDTSSSEVKDDETLLLAPPGISQANNAEEGPELGVHEQSIGRNEDVELNSNKTKINMETAVNSVEQGEHKDDREPGNEISTAIEPGQYMQEWEPNDSKQEECVSNATKSYIDGHSVDEMTPHETVQTQGKQPVEPQKNFLEPSSPSEATNTTQNTEDCSVTLQDLNEEKEEDSTPENATQRELQVSSGFDLCGDLPYIPAVEEASNTEEYLVPEIQGAPDPQNNEMEPRSCTNNYSQEISSDADQFQNNSQQTGKVSCADDSSIRPISENYGHTSEEVTENQDKAKSTEQLIEMNNEEQTIEDITDGRGRQAVKSEMTVEENLCEEDYGPHATSASDSTEEKLVPAGSVEIVERSSETELYKENKKVEDEIMEEKEETNADTESHETEFYEIDNDADKDGKTLSNTECNTKSDECSITISKDSKEISEEPNISVTSMSLEGEAVREIFQQNTSGETTENEARPMEPKMDASELLHQMNIPKPDNMDVNKETQQESAKNQECCSALEPQQGNDRILFSEIQVTEDLSSREVDSDHSEVKSKLEEIPREGKFTTASDVHMDCQEADKVSAAEIIATHICQEIEAGDKLQQPSFEHQKQRPETSTLVTGVNDNTFNEEALHDESTENSFMSFDNTAETICAPAEREVEHPSLEAEPSSDSVRLNVNSVRTDPEELSPEFQGVKSSAEVESYTENSTLERLNIKEICPLNENRETDELSELNSESQPVSGDNLVNSSETSTENLEPVIELQSEKLAISEEIGNDAQLQTGRNEIMGESNPSNIEVYEAVATDAAGEEEMHAINTMIPSEDRALVQPPLPVPTTKSSDEIADEHSANTTFSVVQVSAIDNALPTEEKVSEQLMKQVSNQDSNITQTMQIDKEEQLQGNYDDFHQSSRLQELCCKDSVNMRIDEPVDTVDVIYNGMNVEDFSKEGSESNTNEAASLKAMQSVTTSKEEITACKHKEAEEKPMLSSIIGLSKGGEDFTVAQNQQENEKNAVEEPKTEEKEDTENDHGEEDSELKPMISSRDVELKTQNKKSQHILSGMGSKMKNSISKVKKAMACASPQFSPDDVIIKLNKSKKS